MGTLIDFKHGPNVKIEKNWMMSHVQKRMRTRLRNLKKEHRWRYSCRDKANFWHR